MGEVRGERTTLSVAAHFSSLNRLVFSKRNGGRASGCTTVVRTPRPGTRVILYISAPRACFRARRGGVYPAMLPPRSLDQSCPRYARCHVALALRRFASCRVAACLLRRPLPVNRVFTPPLSNRGKPLYVREFAITRENVRPTQRIVTFSRGSSSMDVLRINFDSCKSVSSRSRFQEFLSVFPR